MFGRKLQMNNKEFSKIRNIMIGLTTFVISLPDAIKEVEEMQDEN